VSAEQTMTPAVLNNSEKESENQRSNKPTTNHQSSRNNSSTTVERIAEDTKHMLKSGALTNKELIQISKKNLDFEPPKDLSPAKIHRRHDL
jgi:hypothetical protein